MKHLDDRELADLVAGRLGPDEWQRAIQHLLSGCARCCTKLTAPVPERLLVERRPPVTRGARSYDAAFEAAAAQLAVHEARWRKDQEKLARGLALLRDNPQGYDGLTLRQVNSLRGWPLVEALLRRSWELRFSDKKQMKWLAYNAVVAAEGLQPEQYSRAFLFDLRGHAWGELGNAYRINEEFGLAQHAVTKARAMLAQGTGDLLLLAMAARQEANLSSDRRELARACELLELAFRIYLGLGERHLAGEALVSRARNFKLLGDSRRALCLFGQGLELLDHEREPLIASVCQSTFLDTLVKSGELSQAGQLLLRSGLRQAFAAHPRLLLSLRWLEGNLFAGFGELARAERALCEVRTEFLERGYFLDAALVGHDLVPVWVQQGRFGQVRKLSRDMLDTFRQMEIQCEATKALRYLQQT